MMRVCASRLFLLFQLKAIWSNMENMSVKSFYFSSIVIVSYCRRLLRPNCLIGDYRFIGRTRKMESSAVILPIQGAQYVAQFVSTRTNLLSYPPPKSTLFVHSMYIHLQKLNFGTQLTKCCQFLISHVSAHCGRTCCSKVDASVRCRNLLSSAH